MVGQVPQRYPTNGLTNDAGLRFHGPDDGAPDIAARLDCRARRSRLIGFDVVKDESCAQAGAKEGHRGAATVVRGWLADRHVHPGVNVVPFHAARLGAAAKHDQHQRPGHHRGSMSRGSWPHPTIGEGPPVRSLVRRPAADRRGTRVTTRLDGYAVLSPGCRQLTGGRTPRDWAQSPKRGSTRLAAARRT